jgi:multidrug efflux pump
MQKVRDAIIFAISPPPIPELGRGTGFVFRLQDRGDNGHTALVAARNRIARIGCTKSAAFRCASGRPGRRSSVAARYRSREGQRVGRVFDAINTGISTALGAIYVNDFPNDGRLQRGVVQADAPSRMQPDDLLKLNAVNIKGQAVPLSAFAVTRWITGPMQTVRYNGYPSMRITGDATPGHSTGEAIAEMERLATQLPPGFAYEWTGQSREEKLAGSTVFILLGFSMLAVFLALAALYESWSIPMSVLLVVPLGVFGAVLAVTMRGFPSDVYFKVGLITIIGLGAKNAVLIVEFAKDQQAQGKSLIEAALAASHLRFRPILMTSLAFILGVLPLAIASGAGSASQRAIGTGVMGGMLTATTLGVLFVPIFFVVVRSIFKGSERQRRKYAHEDGKHVVAPPPATESPR